MRGKWLRRHGHDGAARKTPPAVADHEHDGTAQRGNRRRERVIRVFPNEASAIRLIGALLAEVNETWKERVYLRGERRLGAGRGPESTHERERESGVTARSTRTDFTATLGRDVATSSAAFTAL